LGQEKENKMIEVYPTLQATIFNGSKGLLNKLVYNYIVRNEDKKLTFIEMCSAVSSEYADSFRGRKKPTPFQVALAIRALRRAGMVK